MRSTRRKRRPRRKTRGGGLFSDLGNSFMYSITNSDRQFAGSYAGVNPMWTVQPIGRR